MEVGSARVLGDLLDRRGYGCGEEEARTVRLCVRR
jgi:hypothetical protein